MPPRAISSLTSNWPSFPPTRLFPSHFAMRSLLLAAPDHELALVLVEDEEAAEVVRRDVERLLAGVLVLERRQVTPGRGAVVDVDLLVAVVADEDEVGARGGDPRDLVELALELDRVVR